MGFLDSIFPALVRPKERGDAALIAQIRANWEKPEYVSGVGSHRSSEPISGSPFTEVPINLGGSSNALDGVGVPVAVEGYGIYYRRRGSAPSGRLTISLGGDVHNFAPGDTIRGRFTGFIVTRPSGSGQFALLNASLRLALANLVVLKTPSAEYVEPADLPSPHFDPIPLLGLASADGSVTAITVAKAFVPSVGSDGFEATGFRKFLVQVYASGGANNNGLTLSIVPMVAPRTIAGSLWTWHELDAKVFTLSEAIDSSILLRAHILECAGITGRLSFVARDVSPADVTDLNYVVWGVA